MWFWFGMAAAYAAIFVVVSCAPFEWIHDREQINARYEGKIYPVNPRGGEFFGVQLRSRELTGYRMAGLTSIFWNVPAVK